LAEDEFTNCDEDNDALPNGLKGGFRYLGFGGDGPLVTVADYETFNDRVARAAASLEEMSIEVEYSKQMSEG
jgi:hypothetical protein